MADATITVNANLDDGQEADAGVVLLTTAAGDDGLTYAFPGDYWPDEYWAGYWPDYGTDDPEPPAGDDGLTYAFPGDYWPDRYWAEYWPDYGTDDPEPPATIIPLVMHHLSQQGVS